MGYQPPTLFWYKVTVEDFDKVIPRVEETGLHPENRFDQAEALEEQFPGLTATFFPDSNEWQVWHAEIRRLPFPARLADTAESIAIYEALPA